MLNEPDLGQVPSAVVIGGSAGSVEALSQLLPHIPKDFSWPIVVVVHLPAERPSVLPALCAEWCVLPVREPFDKEPVAGGILWIAPPDYHLLVEGSPPTFALSLEPPVHHSRPSIDVLFESASDVYGDCLLGIVLTGANDDGARGAQAIREAGGFVIVQDPESALARRMPEAAIARANPQIVTDIDGIGRYLHSCARR